MAKLDNAAMGTFVIRSSDKSFAALSMVSPTGLYHMHIESSGGNYTVPTCKPDKFCYCD